MSNVGGLDRMVRIVAGALLVALAAVGVLGPWAFIGIVPLATGLIRYCPLYKVFGINTCPVQKE